MNDSGIADMSDILTITFNPALDKSFSVQELAAGRKLACSQLTCDAGGGGINIARAITSLGGKVTAFLLAGGPIGGEVTRLLSEKNIPFKLIPIKSPTRENLIVTDLASDRQYLFDMPGPAVSRVELKRCLTAVKRSCCRYIVVSGSLPPGVPLSVYEEMAAIACKKGAKLFVDASGPALAAALQSGVYLVKPNLREITALTGAVADRNGAIAAAKSLITQNKCEFIMVSMGAEGAVLVGNNSIISIDPPPVHSGGTVGAGDSLLAGLVFSLWRGWSIEQASAYGVACGSAATLNKGTAHFTRAQANRLYSQMCKKKGTYIHITHTNLNEQDKTGARYSFQ